MLSLSACQDPQPGGMALQSSTAPLRSYMAAQPLEDTHSARAQSQPHSLAGAQAARQQDASQDEDALPQVTVDGCAGGVHTFIVEPFVPHQHEFYLCIQSERLGDVISFR